MLKMPLHFEAETSRVPPLTDMVIGDPYTSCHSGHWERNLAHFW